MRLSCRLLALRVDVSDVDGCSIPEPDIAETGVDVVASPLANVRNGGCFCRRARDAVLRPQFVSLGRLATCPLRPESRQFILVANAPIGKGEWQTVRNETHRKIRRGSTTLLNQMLTLFFAQDPRGLERAGL